MRRRAAGERAVSFAGWPRRHGPEPRPATTTCVPSGRPSGPAMESGNQRGDLFRSHGLEHHAAAVFGRKVDAVGDELHRSCSRPCRAVRSRPIRSRAPWCSSSMPVEQMSSRSGRGARARTLSSSRGVPRHARGTLRGHAGCRVGCRPRVGVTAFPAGTLTSSQGARQFRSVGRARWPATAGSLPASRWAIPGSGRLKPEGAGYCARTGPPTRSRTLRVDCRR